MTSAGRLTCKDDLLHRAIDDPRSSGRLLHGAIDDRSTLTGGKIGAGIGATKSDGQWYEPGQADGRVAGQTNGRSAGLHTQTGCAIQAAAPELTRDLEAITTADARLPTNLILVFFIHQPPPLDVLGSDQRKDAPAPGFRAECSGAKKSPAKKAQPAFPAGSVLFHLTQNKFCWPR